MAEVTLPNGPATSRLGFGCARIFGGTATQASLTVLNTALDAGVRHFDVAPYYGFGSAEAIVGRFLASHRDQVTVATKFGLRPPRGGRLFRAARAALRPFQTELPKTMLRVARRLTPAPSFTPAALEASLRASQRRLGCERIDVLLLHEATYQDLTDELATALGRAAAAGSIRCWGIGSERSRIAPMPLAGLSGVAVLQYEWSVLSAGLLHTPGKFLVTHQAMSGALGAVHALLADRDRRRLWSQAVGAPLDDRRVLARWLLAAALHNNPAGIVLFSSNDPARVRSGASALELASCSSAGRLVALAAAERQRAVIGHR